MDQKTDRLYPSAPLEIIDSEQRLEKKNDVNSFTNSVNNIKWLWLHTSNIKLTNPKRKIKHIKQ